VKRVLLSFCILLSFGQAGDTGKIAGRVVDARTNQPLPLANVLVAGQELGAATDNTGFYVILNVPVGRASVEASILGYQAMQVSDAVVQADRTTRIDFRLEPSTISMPKVVVRAERPMVSKEMVAARYAVRAEDMLHMPADRLPELVMYSASVVRTESTYHVRGGRANEVDYLIDGVSVVDPLSGELGVELARGVADEVIFMPGGFSAEYGRAMSGVINLVTVNPRSSYGAGYRVKSEKPMPLYYDFGYTDHGMQVHAPVLPGLRAVGNFGLTLTDDWDPRLFILPHKARQDYSVYGKAFYEFEGKIKLAVSGIASRTQLDRYDSNWKLLLDDYRSDLRHGGLLVGKLSYMPNSRAIYIFSLSQFITDKTYGVRRTGQTGWFSDISFRDTSEYVEPVMDINNPWGCPYESYWFFYTRGTYEDFRKTRSRTWTAQVTGSNQVTSSHLITAGASADLYHLSSARVRWPAFRPVIDTYAFAPNNVSAYVQDKIEYEELYANIGVRYDQFDAQDSVKVDTVTWRAVPVARQLSPRLGLSFRITEWLFARANFGYYFQMPWFGALYDNTVNPVKYRTFYGDTTKLVVGNPELKPERTQSYELGLQGEVAKGLLLTANLWRKDVRDLIGTREVPALPRRYVTYLNVDYAQLTGAELIVEVRRDWLSGKLSYTYSRARGTSSYANEGYDRFLSQGDSSVPAREYALDFEQPHRVFGQIDMRVPERAFGVPWLDAIGRDIGVYVLGYYGTGLPYSPPGSKTEPGTKNSLTGPARSNVDALITKDIHVGRFKFSLVAEVLNVLDIRDQLHVYSEFNPVNYDDFRNRTGQLAIRWTDPDYDPRRDYNHDGYLSQYEEWRSTYLYYKATIDWPNYYGPPRRARLGIEVGF